MVSCRAKAVSYRLWAPPCPPAGTLLSQRPSRARLGSLSLAGRRAPSRWLPWWSAPLVRLLAEAVPGGRPRGKRHQRESGEDGDAGARLRRLPPGPIRDDERNRELGVHEISDRSRFGAGNEEKTEPVRVEPDTLLASITVTTE